MIISEIYSTAKFGDVEIIGYKDSRNVTVKFLNTKSTAIFTAGNIRKGLIKDKFARIVKGVGYLGNGVSSVNGGHKKSYVTWINMLQRCYSESFHIKQKTYSSCTVCEEWLNFEVFEIWHDKNYIDGFELDKDIRIAGNKVYSPDACSFVSHKENMIKAHAKSYRFKSQCSVIVDVYNLDEFCRVNNLHAPCMSQVHLGNYIKHKGWTKAD